MKTKHWILLFAGIFLCSCLCLLLFSLSSSDALIAEIYHDGILIETIRLSNLDTPTERVLSFGQDENRIFLEKDGVSMTNATCPDKLCVRQGKIKNSLFPIVCLPNRITIKLRGADPLQPDAIAR